MYAKGDKIKVKATRTVATIVGPSDRAFHGVHNFWIVDMGGWTSIYSAKEIEAV